MRKLLIASVVLLPAALVALVVAGCDKEKVVNSTEYVERVEYVEVPGDTVVRVDTVFHSDSVTVQLTDTVRVTDTVMQVEHVYDTVVQVNTVYDTVVTTQHHYDTTIVTDTVLTVRCDPNEYLAFTALQYHTDPQVIDFINQEFGYSDGWIFYSSAFQVDLTAQGTDTYDIYGYIDYWTPDWSAYYPLEFYWRLIHTGGDPADPANWQMTDPPAVAPGRPSGISIVGEASTVQFPRH